jgi:transketolase
MGSNKTRDIIFNPIIDRLVADDYYVINVDRNGIPFIAMEKIDPMRSISVGIAEQNMISVACGLALSGKRVITYSSGPFAYLRAYDQLRNAMCLMNLPVTVVVSSESRVSSRFGFTHHMTEDYQLLALCPNLRFFSVADVATAHAVSDYILSGVEGPTYVRLEFECDGDLEAVENPNLKKGFRKIRSGSGALVLAQGCSVVTACETAFATQPAIIDVFGHPFNIEALYEEILKYKKVIVFDERQTVGGLGSELLGYANEYGINKQITMVCVQQTKKLTETCGEREYWMRISGVDNAAIKAAVDG